MIFNNHQHTLLLTSDMRAELQNLCALPNIINYLALFNNIDSEILLNKVIAMPRIECPDPQQPNLLVQMQNTEKEKDYIEKMISALELTEGPKSEYYNLLKYKSLLEYKLQPRIYRAKEADIQNEYLQNHDDLLDQYFNFDDMTQEDKAQEQADEEQSTQDSEPKTTDTNAQNTEEEKDKIQNSEAESKDTKPDNEDKKDTDKKQDNNKDKAEGADKSIIESIDTKSDINISNVSISYSDTDVFRRVPNTVIAISKEQEILKTPKYVTAPIICQNIYCIAKDYNTQDYSAYNKSMDRCINYIFHNVSTMEHIKSQNSTDKIDNDSFNTIAELGECAITGRIITAEHAIQIINKFKHLRHEVQNIKIKLDKLSNTLMSHIYSRTKLLTGKQSKFNPSVMHHNFNIIGRAQILMERLDKVFKDNINDMQYKFKYNRDQKIYTFSALASLLNLDKLSNKMGTLKSLFIYLANTTMILTIIFTLVLMLPIILLISIGCLFKITQAQKLYNNIYSLGHNVLTSYHQKIQDSLFA